MDKIRKGDEVIVLTGKDQGKRGTVQQRVDETPLVVWGVNVAKRHQNPNPANTQFGRVVDRLPARAAVFDRWLAGLLRAYSDRVVPVTVEVAQEWGRLNVPDPVPVVDGLLAATAKVHDWTLVTRNVGDVACTGARLLNPFTATP